ncbi:MAG: zinc metallopeptidase [Alphaproteobacteria bacterium]|jgi:hypothetical protein|nr:zinc metallopeptidase [Alphaproteobacteria bacterium]
MPILALLGLLLIFAVVLGPGLWAKATLSRHASHRRDIPGTGGELARHLLDRVGLETVAVEAVPDGDHYDPAARAVRLSPTAHDGHSVTAVAVAAHEVGHAIQHRDAYGPLEARTRLVKTTVWVQRLGAGVAYASPLMGMFAQSPGVMLAFVAAGVASMGVAVLVNLVTLPVEFDASFARALPILEQGGYLDAADIPAARRILTACALTYLAASLMSLVQFWRWVRFFR